MTPYTRISFIGIAIALLALCATSIASIRTPALIVNAAANFVVLGAVILGFRAVRCSHTHQRPIYGDEIIAARYNRAQCLDCGTLLPDLPDRPTTATDEDS